MKSVYKLLIRKKLAHARQLIAQRSKHVGRESIERYQVARFNEVWQDARRHVPFYANWQKSFCLPDMIESLEDLRYWPMLTKADLRCLDNFVRDDCPEPAGRIMTGGSTGEPLRLPSWGDANDGAAQIVGRWAYGVGPGSRTFLLWGHRHLYGTGFKRRVTIAKRAFKDWLAGWQRVSAYDLGAIAMRRAYRKMVRFHPEFVIGFSAAVLAFCRQNADRAGQVHGVKVVLCSAGPLTDSEISEIETFFSAKVCMEYGSVECAVMAYTNPEDGWYDVFWNTHLLQAVRQPDGEYKNIVTRLSHDYIPLIRYDVGDYLDLGISDTKELLCAERSLLRMRRVKGRPTEMITFACGVSFFGALIGDCVKQVDKVIASQMVVDEDSNVLEIRVTARSPLTSEDQSLILNRLRLTVDDAYKLNVRINVVDELEMTVGGKVPRVIRRRTAQK